MEHWRQHQELKEWDNSKVILGLLLQPGVKEAWRELLTSAGIDPEFDPAPQWARSEVEHVQLQLEIREDSVVALAALAFNKSSYYIAYQAKIPNHTLQPCDQVMDVFCHPSIEQNTISTTQLPNEEFLQIPSDSAVIDNRLHASHEDRANSYHGEAPGLAQILPEIEHGRFQSTIGSYEDIGTTCQQITGFHDHSNLFDLDPSGGTTGSMFGSETLSSSPWSTYTASQRFGLAQAPVLSEGLDGVEASSDLIPSGMHMHIASDRSADQPEIDLPQHDSMPTGNLSSSVDEATPDVPARRKSSRPKVIGRSKRKLSGSPTRDSRWDREKNPVVVEMGRTSRHHHHDDHLRSRKADRGLRWS